MFHRMPTGDLVFLIAIMAMAAAAFILPPLRTTKFLGVALFGWWMAILMFLAPLLALVRMLQERKRR